MQEASRRCDHVITSGGVGPTHDDVTMAGVARGLGVALKRHLDLESRLRTHYGDRLTSAHLRMADVPLGATFIDSDGFRWPVIVCRNVYVLPGVPSLFRIKFEAIRATAATPYARLYIRWDEGHWHHFG